jgi:hypothetical protein
MRVALAAGVLLLTGCASPDVPELRGVGVPRAVKAFVARREACNRQPTPDCARLDAQAGKLKARYGADPRVAKAIDESVGW